MITVEIREKRLGGTPVLGQIAFTLKSGETLAISGASGVGKTTLLRVLAGLDRDFDGTVQGTGRIAMVFQEPVLLRWRNVVENITLTTGVDEQTARDALEEVGLAAHAHQFPDQLSMGQQRRLSLARAFSGTPDLLLLDEPFVSLDPDLVEDMLSLTERLLAARRIATILVTHTQSEARRLATRLARLTGCPATLETLS